jgi:hypothetical protein
MDLTKRRCLARLEGLSYVALQCYQQLYLQHLMEPSEIINANSNKNINMVAAPTRLAPVRM